MPRGLGISCWYSFRSCPNNLEVFAGKGVESSKLANCADQEINLNMHFKGNLNNFLKVGVFVPGIA